ncbi:MAG: carboxypeptidase regulatory-like domain-containing protein [Calditrichia bacterium]|nr:carboxypeptidase regulatory-like domain-containing protein [Calditrichia bacterium]
MAQQSISLLLLVVFFLLPVSCKDEDRSSHTSKSTISQKDSIYTSRVISYLRKNFDDIHDVSMRFHHQDHTLNGLMVFEIKWKNGKMQSANILENETGNEEFAKDLIEKMQTWYIKGIEEHFEMNLPLRFRIVGSNDSTFSTKSILTGEVKDKKGDSVKDAKIDFIATSNIQDSIAACYTNREGIFVRTLIPSGLWDIRCSCEGYQDILIKNFNFVSGEHHRQTFLLIKKIN